MFTKKDYAEYLVREYINETTNSVDIRSEIDYESLVNEIPCSTRLGIALQYLGYVKNPSMIEYINNRGGTEKIYTKFVDGKPVTKILTVREMFDLLPDEEEDK